MQIATTEKVAKFLYQRAVAIPQWDKEQSSFKNRFFIEAEKFMGELDEAGLVIARIEVVEQNSKPSEEELPFIDPLIEEEEVGRIFSGEEGPLWSDAFGDETHEVPTEENVGEKPEKKRGRGRPKKS